MTIPPARMTRINDRGEQVIDLGISGSRIGMSEIQKQIFANILVGKTGTIHLGDCIGVDKEVYDIIKAGFSDKWKTIGHPPANDSKRAFCNYDETRPAKSYFERNKDIVNECNVFFAFPKSLEEVGGTWYTINYFRTVIATEFKMNPPRPPRVGSIILPDGRVGNIIVEGKTRASLNVNGHKII